MEKKNRNTIESLADDFVDIDALRRAMPSKAQTRRSKKRLASLYSSLRPSAPIDTDTNVDEKSKEEKPDGDQ
jgi:hypothetical protein